MMFHLREKKDLRSTFFTSFTEICHKLFARSNEFVWKCLLHFSRVHLPYVDITTCSSRSSFLVSTGKRQAAVNPSGMGAVVAKTRSGNWIKERDSWKVLHHILLVNDWCHCRRPLLPVYSESRSADFCLLKMKTLQLFLVCLKRKQFSCFCTLTQTGHTCKWGLTEYHETITFFD